MSTRDAFASTESLEVAARADPCLSEVVAKLHLLRYAADRSKFDALIWLALGNAMCVGARLAIGELQQEAAK